jgi:tight adherence protein B
VSGAVSLAALAGGAGALAVVDLIGGSLVVGGDRVARGAAGLVEVVVTLGREGRDPGAAERRRLLLAGAGLALVCGWVLVGPLGGVALASGGPWLVARVLRARRERFREAVDRGVPALALAVADALAGGHSLRSALDEATRSTAGAVRHELLRVCKELAVGAPTDAALEAMRARARSPRLDAFVAACVLQRRAGGDLAHLLRDSARAMEEDARLEGELRAASAQARFTGVLVAGLPLGGAALAELVSPGWIGSLFGSLISAWLVAVAIVLQLVAAALIRRLGRVSW